MTFLKDPSQTAPEASEPASEPELSPAPTSAPTPTAKPASHDNAPPAALLEFMVRDWAKPSDALPEPIDGHEYFAARRRALSARFAGETLVIATGHEKVRANDTHYPFRPGSDFFYYTGNTEPDGVLVLEPRADGAAGHTSVLFVEPNPGKTDATFFTDRVKGELWVGPRLGVAQSRARYAVDECRPLATLRETLEKLAGAKSRVRVLRGIDAQVDEALPFDDAHVTRERDAELATFASEQRLLKDPWEVQQLEAAIASTHRGFDDVIARLAHARSEREVEGVFYLRARTEGNDVGYGTIAACGGHACTLHWTRNDGAVRAGDLLLLDAGVEAHTLYTADITRCLPVSGRFTPEQREVYELVLAAQTAALAEVRPGLDFLAPNRAAMRVLTEGLVHMGIVRVSVDEALDDAKQLFKRYTLHNVSHMLGIDVHDCAKARQEAYKFGTLRPGMVLTVEPGLYFQPDDLTVPERYRGIGVRIEDDVLVTDDGHRNLSAAIPREADAVEAWMASVWARAK